LRLPFSYFSVRVSGDSSPRLRVPRGIAPRNVRCVSCQQIGLLSLDPPRLGPVLLGPVLLGPVAGAQRTLELSLLLLGSESVRRPGNLAKILWFPSQRSGSMTVRCIPVVHLVPLSSESPRPQVAGEAVLQRQLPCMHLNS
jgi:hypothetical protein